MNFFDTVIYIIGREFRTFRILYWKLSKGRYLWGVQLGLYDNYSTWNGKSKEILS